MLNDAVFAQLVRKIDPASRLISAQRLTGGISAVITLLEVAQAGGAPRRVIVRQHGETDLRENPNVATDEFRLLQILRAEGIPAPQPLHVEPSGDLFPTPVIVVEYVEGMTEFAPDDANSRIDQLAAQLVALHRIDGARADLAFLPRQAARYIRRLNERPPVLDDSLREGDIRAALVAASPPQVNAPTLLHGDYWMGNILWRGGRLAAVIDWEDAATGDPLADVGNTRLEMLWSFGVEAAERFTAAYRAACPALDDASLPYWDLYAALRPAGKITEWAGDAASERRMRERHAWFVAQALAALENHPAKK